MIAGAGLGGVSAALSLKSQGIDDVVIFEQADALEKIQVGIGMILWPNGARALKEIGVKDKLEERDNQVAEVNARAPKGSVLSSWCCATSLAPGRRAVPLLRARRAAQAAHLPARRRRAEARPDLRVHSRTPMG
jgi:2-polyprenyl-6-methoxyphenol hydroxylase-like FAD-dependent oxidoreductase